MMFLNTVLKPGLKPGLKPYFLHGIISLFSQNNNVFLFIIFIT